MKISCFRSQQNFNCISEKKKFRILSLPNGARDARARNTHIFWKKNSAPIGRLSWMNRTPTFGSAKIADFTITAQRARRPRRESRTFFERKTARASLAKQKFRVFSQKNCAHRLRCTNYKFFGNKNSARATLKIEKH